MTVFSKILSGSMRVETYTSTMHLATQNADSTTPVLTILPNGDANMHSFTALSDQVFFIDVITPPYENNCTYYTIENNQLKRNDSVDFHGEPVVYNGPKVYTNLYGGIIGMRNFLRMFEKGGAFNGLQEKLVEEEKAATKWQIDLEIKKV